MQLYWKIGNDEACILSLLDSAGLEKALLPSLTHINEIIHPFTTHVSGTFCRQGAVLLEGDMGAPRSHGTSSGETSKTKQK